MKNLGKGYMKSMDRCRNYVMIFVIALVLGTGYFSMICHAESAAKVTANSANIRSSADPSSTVVGSTEKGKKISIVSQTKGTDGKIWYEVYIDANTMGYIRSDLLEITDGSTPPTKEGGAAATTTEEGGKKPATTVSVDVTAVSPTEGTVKGSDSVRVRSDATTQGNNIVATVKKGQAVTITGTAKAKDGKEWYQVTFSADGQEKEGFIRSDYVEFSGELGATTPEEAPAEEEAPVEEEKPAKEEKQKEFDTGKDQGVWYLYDYTEQKQYNITEFISANQKYAELYAQAQKQIKNQKMILIVLGGVAVLLVVVIAVLVFKVRDAKDSAYFEQVEQETMRRRQEAREQQRSQARASSASSTSSNNRRPAQSGSTQGQVRRGTNTNTQRPASSQSRTAGEERRAPQNGAVRQRPQSGEGRRPVQQGAGGQQRGPKPGAQSQARSQQMPSRQAPQRNPQAGGQARQSSAGRPQSRPENGGQTWKTKNFIEEDDEFEFEFLNKWEDEE